VPTDPGLHRRDLLAVNGSGIALLLAGLLNTLLIPKMAIAALGTEEYGRFAFLLGFCFLPTIVDFGLMPGLTREIGRLCASNDTTNAMGLARRIQLLVAVVGALVTGVVGIFVTAITGAEAGTFAVILAGGGANILVMITDIGMLVRRVQGRIVQANAARGVYYLVYLVCVWTTFSVGRISVAWMFYGQAAGALAYAVAGWWQYHEGRAVQPEQQQRLSVPWRRLWKAAAPEQLARAQSAVLPGAERTLLLMTGGARELSAYDVAIRISAIVTALPAIVAEPVLALLSSRAKPEHSTERALILRHATQVTRALTLGGVAFASLLAVYWAEPYYHLDGTTFRTVALLVMFGSAVNVLTATPVAAMYSVGKVTPVLGKGFADLAMAAIALGVGSSSGKPLSYVAIRYLGYLLTAGSLLLYWHTSQREMAVKGHQAASDGARAAITR
jgi:hypothetical protein